MDIQNKRLAVNSMNANFVPIHINAETEFIIVKKGCFTAIVNNEKRKLHAKECTVVFPYQLHSFEKGENTEIAVLMFPRAATEDFLVSFQSKIPAKSVFCLSDSCFEYILTRLFDVQNTTDLFQMKSVFYPLAAEYIKSTEFSEVKHGKENPELQKIVDYLYTNMAEELTLKKLSAKFGVSVVSLNRMFVENLHVKPLVLLNNLRIERANYLLERKDLSITEIACICGFSSLRTFNRAFKKTMGCTPSDFRKL